MFFSLTLVIQFGLLWLLITLLAHEDQQSSLTMTMKILVVFFIAKIGLRLLVAFQFPEIHWSVTMCVEFALLYFLIWKITDTPHKITAYIWLSFVAASVGVEICFRLLASAAAKSLSQ